MKKPKGLPHVVAVALAASLAFGAVPARADNDHDGWHWREHHEREHWDHDRDRHWHRWHDDDDDWGGVFGGLGLVFAPHPPAVYAPAPAYYLPPLPAGVAPASPVYRTGGGRYCREYWKRIWVNGYVQPGYGTVCLDDDGDAWRFVN